MAYQQSLTSWMRDQKEPPYAPEIDPEYCRRCNHRDMNRCRVEDSEIEEALHLYCQDKYTSRCPKCGYPESIKNAERLQPEERNAYRLNCGCGEIWDMQIRYSVKEVKG